MANGGLDTNEASQSQWEHMTRSAARRAKRKHAHRCWKLGNTQLQMQVKALQTQLDLYDNQGPIDALVLSLAVHSADSEALGRNIHYASNASCCAKAAGIKTKSLHKQHLQVHREANNIKHNVFGQFQQLFLPVPDAIECSDLEAFMQTLYDPCSAITSLPIQRVDANTDGCITDARVLRPADTPVENPKDHTSSVTICTWCGLWQPMDGVRGSLGLTSPSAADEACSVDLAGKSGTAREAPPQLLPMYGLVAVADAGRAAAASWSMWSLMAPGIAEYQADVGSESID
jgi:hypothetical protein